MERYRELSVTMESRQRIGFDITVRLEEQPGTLASLGEALGAAGVNIDGICGVPCEGKILLHLLVQDLDLARQVLMDSGYDIENERTVLLVDVIDRPGELGGIARRLADDGINIDLLYLTAGMDLVIGVEPIDRAAEILQG
jgi:hypothetical protein